MTNIDCEMNLPGKGMWVCWKWKGETEEILFVEENKTIVFVIGGEEEEWGKYINLHE